MSDIKPLKVTYRDLAHFCSIMHWAACEYVSNARSYAFSSVLTPGIFSPPKNAGRKWRGCPHLCLSHTFRWNLPFGISEIWAWLLLTCGSAMNSSSGAGGAAKSNPSIKGPVATVMNGFGWNDDLKQVWEGQTWWEEGLQDRDNCTSVIVDVLRAVTFQDKADQVSRDKRVEFKFMNNLHVCMNRWVRVWVEWVQKCFKTSGMAAKPQNQNFHCLECGPVSSRQT